MALKTLRHYAVILGTCITLHTPTVAADELGDIETLLNQARHAQALERVSAYLANKPKDARGRFLKGIILTELNKPADAIQVFTGLTEDYPQLPEPYNNLAVLYAAQGQYDKARVALELAIHTHPSYATAYENLGDIYAKLASRAYDKALQLDKSNAAAQDKLAMIKDLFDPRTARTVLAARNTPAAKPVAEKPVTAPIVVRPEPPTVIAAAPAKPVTPPPAPPAPVTTAPAPQPSASVAQASAPAPVAPAANTKPATPEPMVAAAPAKPASRDQDVNAIVDSLQAWARAWSDKDVESYLGFYAPSFESSEAGSRRAWEESRRVRIKKPGPIQVNVRDVEVLFGGDNQATVRFTQSYRSANLNSTNRKTLRMVRQGQLWRIEQERVGG